MRLRIARLGPIVDSEIDIDGVTLLMGPPNTGKSYTLRAIYSKLLPLDAYALMVAEDKLSRDLRVYMERVFRRQALNVFQELAMTVLKVLLAFILLEVGGIERRNFEAVFHEFVRRVGYKGVVEWRDHDLVAKIEIPPVGISLDSDFIEKISDESLHEFVAENISIPNVRSVILEPEGLLKVSINFMGEPERYKFIYNIRHLLVSFTKLFDSIILYLQDDRRDSRSIRSIVEQFTSISIKRLLKYVNIRLYCETTVMFDVVTDGVKLASALAVIIRLPRRDIGREGEVEPSVSASVRVVDELWHYMLSNPAVSQELRLVTAIAADTLIDAVAGGAAKVLSKSLARGLREITESRLGLRELRFIPFGRSTFILGLESASRDPFTKSRFLHELIRFYPTPHASYVYWASKGRSRLLEGRLQGRRAKLLRAITPLLEGRLVGSSAEGIMYRDWRGSVVGLYMSSALVGEVTGLVLPLLTVEDSGMVLIEEPEAQLHPGAQIVMALFLASLPELCGCRVVASTHSDLMAITLSLLAVQRPGRDEVRDFLDRLLPHIHEGKEVLASAVAEAVETLSVKVYEFTREGRVKPVSPADVLGREVPGISTVIDELTDWAFRLASRRLEKHKG